MRTQIASRARQILARPNFTPSRLDYLTLPTPYAGEFETGPLTGCILGVLLLAAIELGYASPPPAGVFFPRAVGTQTHHAATYDLLVDRLLEFGFELGWLQDAQNTYLENATDEPSMRRAIVLALDDASGCQGRSEQVPGFAYSKS